MKRIVPISLIILLQCSVAYACESKEFKIHFLPLDECFYVPTSYGDLTNWGVEFIHESCLITDLFNSIDSQKGIDPPYWDDYDSDLRILFISTDDGKEILVNREKEVLSMHSHKKYSVDEGKVDAIIDELYIYFEKNKIESLPEVEYDPVKIEELIKKEKESKR